MLFSSSLLVGTWVFTSMIQETPKMIATPSEGLVMTFEFKDDGTNVLHYYKKGDTSSCRRTATYSFENDLLTQLTVDVDPNNAPFCVDDPDMAGDKETVTSLVLKNNQLLMTLPLGEDKLVYVWEPCDNNSPGKTCEELATAPKPGARLGRP